MILGEIFKTTMKKYNEVVHKFNQISGKTEYSVCLLPFIDQKFKNTLWEIAVFGIDLFKNVLSFQKSGT